MQTAQNQYIINQVLPLTREWIEMSACTTQSSSMSAVLPLTREWIEMPHRKGSTFHGASSPSYEGVD